MHQGIYALAIQLTGESTHWRAVDQTFTAGVSVSNSATVFDFHALIAVVISSVSKIALCKSVSC